MLSQLVKARQAQIIKTKKILFKKPDITLTKLNQLEHYQDFIIITNAFLSNISLDVSLITPPHPLQCINLFLTRYSILICVINILALQCLLMRTKKYDLF